MAPRRNGKTRSWAGGSGSDEGARYEQINAQTNERSTVVAEQDTECGHPYCEAVVSVGDPLYKSRNREATYCSKMCRDRHVRILAQKRRREDPLTRERDRGKKIERKYGLSLEEFDALFVAQSGLCAICAVPLMGARVCVDHQHDTGKVRGLLCTPCNTGIGMLGDDPDRMTRAAAYVRNPVAYEASVHAGEEVT